METTSRRTLLTTGAAFAALAGMTTLFAHPLAAQASGDGRNDREHRQGHDRKKHGRHDGRDGHRHDHHN